MRRPCMLIAIKTPAKNAEQWRSGEVRRAARRMPTSTRPDLAWGWRCSGALCSVLSAGSRRERWVRDQTKKNRPDQHASTLAAFAVSTLHAPSPAQARWGKLAAEYEQGRRGQQRPTRAGPLAAAQINLPLSQRPLDVPPQWFRQDGGSKPIDLQSMWQEVPAQSPSAAAPAAA